MSGTFYLGTSGFAYDEWMHGVFYPEGLKQRERLTYYSSQFPSVEINYTFRRFPTEKTLEAWREQVPESFAFTLKANQRITHFKRLAGADEDVRDFLKIAGTLGSRLGCVLFQCPPTLQYDRALIEAFAGYLPPSVHGAPRFAMEFRHPSWREARELLLSQGIAWCVAETDEQDPAPEDLSWEPAGYLRLRKTEYSDEELEGWAARIRPALDAGSDVFCYLKHEDEGASTKMAKRLEALLGIPGPEPHDGIVRQGDSTPTLRDVTVTYRLIDTAGGEIGVVHDDRASIDVGQPVTLPDGRTGIVVEVYDGEHGREGGVAATLVIDEG